MLDVLGEEGPHMYFTSARQLWLWVECKEDWNGFQQIVYRRSLKLV